MIVLGPKYIVCNALCGAWKHQCKLMGILFSITSVLCLLFAIAILYSLQFNFRGKSCVYITVLLHNFQYLAYLQPGTFCVRLLAKQKKRQSYVHVLLCEQNSNIAFYRLSMFLLWVE